MDNLILHFIALWISASDAHRLHRAAAHLIPSDEAAAIHIAGARTGLAVAQMPQREWGTLMALAWHESKFDFDRVFVERDGKLSCGVTTSIPVRTQEECQKNIQRGYVLSAEHLRDWLNAHAPGDKHRLTRREAFQGIAGGWALIDACKLGPILNPWGVDKCEFQKTIDDTAWMITGGAGS